MRDSAESFDPAYGRVRRAGRKRRPYFDDEATSAKRDRHRPGSPRKTPATQPTACPRATAGPPGTSPPPPSAVREPHPEWLVTDLAAVDTELGILKTGKEADVFLLRRGVPGDRPVLPARGQAVPGRGAPAVPPGRRATWKAAATRETRVNRAAANRSAFGRQAIAGQWANAEFTALCQLYRRGVPVPYPVQITGTEVLLEFIGDADGTGAPRLAETRPDGAELAALWDQLVAALADAGRARATRTATCPRTTCWCTAGGW